MPDTLLLLGLAASTLLSEDAACIAAGVLIGQGVIGAGEGVAACAAGIYAGDALLWWAGRWLARRARSRAVPPAWANLLRERGEVMMRHVDSPLAVLASRFLPGTRLPLYLAAGAFGRRPGSFFLWTFVAVLLWTPVIVLGTASTLVGGVLAAAAVHIGVRVEWRRLWWRMSAAVERWRRWEFWPSALLYAPVAVHIVRLAWRHGGLGTLSAANPGIADGGFVGESKFQILAQLPAERTLGAILVGPGETADRLEQLRRATACGGLQFPLILKPDEGQRGVGVRLVKSLAEAGDYFTRQPGAVVAQRYHPGPFEAGIFYYRRPGTTRGRIFGITDKRFPVVVGDGRRTLEELIWAHPRFRLQAAVFLARHAGERHRVPAAGERVRLAIAGNHAQGTTFLDGKALMTPALEHRIDEIARRIPGFYIGRFDVRYADVARFRDGEDVAIVELNGVTSEATHIYDPSYSLFRAVRVLCDQWTLIFEIGAANRAAGHAATSVRRLLRLSLEHLRHTPSLPIAS
jgi:membrane protein DedA with SNARE-associated domain